VPGLPDGRQQANVRLTDGILTDFITLDLANWWNNPVIVADLGKVRSAKTIKAYFASHLAEDIRHPGKLTVFTSEDGARWQAPVVLDAIPADTRDRSEGWISVPLGSVRAVRYVWMVTTLDGDARTLLSEVSAE